MINLGYIIASILFIFGLKMLSSQATAKKGNLVSALGMLIAVITVMFEGAGELAWLILVVGLIVGGAIGLVCAKKVQMTGMPEMVALFNGFGGIASLLVGWAEYKQTLLSNSPFSTVTIIAIFAAVLIGGVTFSGSLIAWARLAEKMDTKPTLFNGQKALNLCVLIVAVILGIMLVTKPAGMTAVFYIIIGISLIFGVLLVIPVGGADMPVVIALDSYSGLAACAAGFVIANNVLIVAGALVGASGLILTNIMCKAMNRSLANVMMAGVGSSSGSGATGYHGEANPISPADTYLMLEAADSVVFVPGYGMAVAQAQHVVRELADLLEANGTEVQFCIHPVAGRMPGHMNVLLAEANVPYEQLVEPDDVNPMMSTVDVAIVIGANDVVNPAARTDENSPLYGMPIIDVDYARTSIVLKRSLRAGFAGVDNPLFFNENNRMLFGDAKASISAVVAEFKG